MKLICNRDEMNKALSAVMDVVDTRAAQAVLHNVKLSHSGSTLTLSATDGMHSVTVGVNASDAAETAEILLPAAKLAGIVKEDDSENLEISVTDEKAVLKTATGKFTLNAFSSEGYPTWGGETKKDQQFAHMIGGDILDAYAKTGFCVSKDGSRFALNGIKVDIEPLAATLASSDTHRLSVYTMAVEHGEKSGGIVPARFFTILSKMVGSNDIISVAITGSYIVAKAKNSRIMSRLIDGTFPDYNRIIPENHKPSFTVNRDEIIRALRLAGMMANVETKTVSIVAKDNAVTVSSGSGESGEGSTTISATVDCDFDACFNWQYMIDCMKAIKEDQIQFDTSGEGTPVSVFSDNFIHLMMPVKKV